MLSLICGDSQNRPPAVPSMSVHGEPGTSVNSSAVEKNSTWTCALRELGGTGRADVADQRAGFDRLVEQHDLAGLAAFFHARSWPSTPTGLAAFVSSARCMYSE